MRKALKWIGIAGVALVAVAVLAYATRSNPVAMVSGRQLTGELVLEPVADWGFTNEHQLIAVETRPAAPHSVTTVCFTHEGVLYVPANRAAEKSWPHYAVSDPRVRIKVGDRIYPAVATRVQDAELQPKLIAAATDKYEFELPQEPGALDEIWVFRIDSAVPDVASGEASTP